MDSTAFTGKLTISGSDYDDTFKLGGGDNDLHATRGEDEYTLGDGEDIIRYTSLAQNGDAFDKDTLMGFDAGGEGDAGKDKIDISYFVKDGVAWDFDLVGDLLTIDFDVNHVTSTDLIIDMKDLVGTLDHSDFITEIA